MTKSIYLFPWCNLDRVFLAFFNRTHVLCVRMIENYIRKTRKKGTSLKEVSSSSSLNDSLTALPGGLVSSLSVSFETEDWCQLCSRVKWRKLPLTSSDAPYQGRRVAKEMRKNLNSRNRYRIPVHSMRPFQGIRECTRLEGIHCPFPLKLRILRFRIFQGSRFSSLHCLHPVILCWLFFWLALHTRKKLLLRRMKKYKYAHLTPKIDLFCLFSHSHVALNESTCLNIKKKTKKTGRL